MRTIDTLAHLAQSLGDLVNRLVICAEGNCSARADEHSFWVKGSGQKMHEANENRFVRVGFDPVLEMVTLASRGRLPDEAAVRAALDAAVIEPTGGKASTEAFMHAALLQEDVHFVAHTHAPHVLALCCRPEAEQEAERRYFPDEVVLCGPVTCFVPYVAPGLPLAQEIVSRRDQFQDRWGIAPKTYWLGNHGLITVGKTAEEALAATLMAEKAAEIRLLAGSQAIHMTPESVSQIANWPDEHYRQRLLFGG